MTDQVNNNYLVSTLKDEDDNDFSEGDLSLREAIALSESGSTITFDPELANGTINLSLGELIIDDSVTIQGLGASHTVINAGGRSRIFNVDDGNEDIQSEVAIADLTITGGNVDSFSETPPENTNDGGGILNAENLTIDRANIHDNSAFFSGGGIASTGKLNVNDSAVYNNSTSSGRFGNNGGGITNDGTAIINQSTISNNETGSRSTGGGIQNNGTLNISNSTVSGNQSGIFNGGESTVTSSIIAKNIDNNDVEGKDFITGGNNLIGGESLDFRVWSAGGFTNDENGDIVGTGNAPIGPKLGEVQDNDGATFTQALHSDSPGVNTGSNPNELETDQRGEGFDRTVGDSIDIGAYELQDNNGGGNPTELVVSTLEDENDGDFGEGDLSLREAIAISESGGTITFDSELANGAIDLSLGQLVIDKSITINGLGASNTVIDAGDRSGVFDINDNTDAVLDVELNNLTITGGGGIPAGDTPLQNRGGGIFNLEDLEINNANIYNNRAFSQGGGIYSDGTLTVNNSAIYENITDSGGRGASGGGITNAGTAIINQSTVSNNNTGGSGAGGIENAEGTLVVTNSTVNGNDVGGISNQSGEVTVTSSIVAGNANNNDVFGDDFISGGNNLIGGENPDIGSANGFTNAENGDIVGTSNAPIDPKLGEIQDNGGATFTQALHSDSPGVNTGSNPNELETDQRGEGFDRTIGDGTDIGAYELQDNNGGGNPTELVVSTLEDENDGDFSEGDLSLREAIILANENQGDDTIKFDNSLTGGTITFNESQERNLTINESVLIEGLGQDNLTLDGGFIFNITPEVGNVIIDGLNLTGGKIDGFGQFRLSNSKISQTIETGSDNSAIISRDRSVIFNSTISDNSGGSNVGILVESGTTAIEGSEIANNQADQGQSGIIVGSEGTVNIINSTIANNRGRSIAGIDNNGRLNITSSTIVGNNGGLNGGGIVNSAQANLISNIVSNNVGGENIGDISGSGESISSGNNLIGNGDNVDGFVNGENDDLVGTKDAPIDPQLGELQNNGGITQTFALKESSPAIDAGNAPSSLLTDQRGEGFARFVGTSPDIGAYELQSVDADDDDTISTANDSGVSPDGQQSVVISNAIASDLDVDLFELELESGDVATFNIEAQEFGSSLDSVLRIFDSEGNELAFDNDSDGPFERANGDSYVEYRAEADGNYYVGVSSFENVSYDPVNADNTSGSSNGDYDLAISAFYGVEGTSGGDNLTGTDEADFISGIDGNDTLSGGESRDNLLGGNGNDIINGGDGDDLLRGEAGSDVLRGGNGNDTLGGNDGQNKLYGGQGNDVFAVGSGSDTIFDFQNDTDKILLTGSFESASFEDLLISTVDQGVGISTQDDSSQVIVLVGVSPELITQDDFVGNEFINPTFRLA